MATIGQIGTRARLLLRGLRYKALLPFTGIAGELSVDEAIALYEVCTMLPQQQPVAVVLGCAHARSSVVLGKGLERQHNPTIYCIDPFDRRGAFDREERAHFVRNLIGAGVRNLVDVLQGRSSDVVLEFRRPIDLLLIDGDMPAEARLRDFRDWAHKVRGDGFLCVHGPDDALAQAVQRAGGWTGCRRIEHLSIFRRQA